MVQRTRALYMDMLPIYYCVKILEVLIVATCCLWGFENTGLDKHSILFQTVMIM